MPFPPLGVHVKSMDMGNVPDVDDAVPVTARVGQVTVIVALADLTWPVVSVSVTTTVAVNVPEVAYMCEGAALVLVAPSPNVHEYEYGDRPPDGVGLKFTVNGAVPELGLAPVDGTTSVGTVSTVKVNIQCPDVLSQSPEAWPVQ